jgi:hypothetical protein
MADDSAPPPASEEPSAAGPGQPQEPQQPPAPVQRYGIVSIARHVKDDGRMLLLYTHEESKSS